ncbi:MULTISPECIES: hypothetical protein [Metallibacterium]|jgi:hypothetical protein|uniref:hypothetical protein n=1 Tax=Metallibacterium TaxID=1218803 RepID=UPI002622EDD7|nr:MULTISPECIES: hypothetical protein [Metallibacterium]MBW8075774.1 hypothetical protein [Metallibacterium scheffleri]
MSAAAAIASRVGIDALLSRLDRVQRGAHGWRADCPNGHKTRGALSVAQSDDGRVLLHCFAGCSTADVLGAAGLTLADVMPERLRDDSPEGRRAARERFRLASVTAAAGIIAREAQIVLIAASDTLRGEDLSPADVARLIEAVERIRDAREALQ